MGQLQDAAPAAHGPVLGRAVTGEEGVYRRIADVFQRPGHAAVAPVHGRSEDRVLDHAEELARRGVQILDLERAFGGELLQKTQQGPALFERWMAIEQRGALLVLLQKLSAEGALEVDDLDAATSQLLSMIEHPILAAAMDWSDGLAVRPLEDVCEGAVDTFLARYGAPEHRTVRGRGRVLQLSH